MKLIACLPVAGLAVSALGQTSARMDLKASTDGGATWVEHALCAPGATVKVGVFISFDTGYGFAGCVYQIRGEWALGGGDTVDITGPGLGRMSPFGFGVATQAVFASGNTFRIDAAGDNSNNRNAGISSGQQWPASAGTNFSTANPALVYTFELHMTNAGGSIINLETPLGQIKGATPLGAPLLGVFASANSTRAVMVTNITVDGCVVDSSVPAPGSVGLLLLAGVSARRRR